MTTKPKKARVSQQQIARDLGLSQPLVSMVLNGRRTGISEKSYERIWDYARRVGYRPKGMTPEALTAKATSVGYIIRHGLGLHTQSSFFTHIQHGLHEYLSDQGYSLVFLGSEDDLDKERLQRLLTDSQSLRGVVVMGEVASGFLHMLKQLEPRLVSVSAQYSGLCYSVLSNEEQSAQQLVQHLFDLGHRRFAWLGGSLGKQRNRQRATAVMSALQLRDISLPGKYQINLQDAGRLEGIQAAEAVLKASTPRDRPTAWICFNSLVARGAINHLLHQGIRVPANISIVSLDQTPVGTEEHPMLTCAGAKPDEMGRVSGKLILQSTGGADEMYSDVVLPSELITRESSAAVRKTARPTSRNAA